MPRNAFVAARNSGNFINNARHLKILLPRPTLNADLSAPLDELFTFNVEISITNCYRQHISIESQCWEVSEINGVTVTESNAIGSLLKPVVEPGETFIFKTALPFHVSSGELKVGILARLPTGELISVGTGPCNFRAATQDIYSCIDNQADVMSVKKNLDFSSILAVRLWLSMSARRRDATWQNAIILKTSQLDLNPAMRIILERFILKFFANIYSYNSYLNKNVINIPLSLIDSGLNDIVLSDLIVIYNYSGLSSIVLLDSPDSSRIVKYMPDYNTRGNDKSLLQIRLLRSLPRKLDALLISEKIPKSMRLSLLSDFKSAYARLVERRERSDNDFDEEVLEKDWVPPPLPSGLTWPTTRYEDSEEFRKRGGLLIYLDRVWRPLIEAGFAERRIAQRLDPVVLKGIKAYTRRDSKTGVKRTLPLPLRFLTIREAREIRVMAEVESVLQNPRNLKRTVKKLAKSIR